MKKGMPMVTHPQALQAIWLASRLHGAPSQVVTQALAIADCPRKLFALASHLQQEHIAKIRADLLAASILKGETA